MKKLNKVAVLFASPLLWPLPLSCARAVPRQRSTTGAMPPTTPIWKNGTNELCWRDASWTPATRPTVATARSQPPAAARSGAAPAARRRPRRRLRRRRPPPPAAARRRPAAAGQREGDLRRRRVLRLRQVGAQARRQGQARRPGRQDQGHQPRSHHRRRPHRLRSATDAYNQKLSVRRAEAVKAYLVSKGIEKNRVYTEGKGEKQPWPTTRPRKASAKNRRVEIEVVGTRTTQVMRDLASRFERNPASAGLFLWRSVPHGRVALRSPAMARQRRPAGTGQIQRPGPPLVGRARASSARCTQINPLRLDWIDRAGAACAARRVLDVGCGGGILAESMARRGAQVTGIDLATKPLKVAQLHALEAGVAGRSSTARSPPRRWPPSGRRTFDVRHLHGDARARARPGVGGAGLRHAGHGPGGWVFFSTHQPQPEGLPVRASSAPSTCCSCCPRARTSTHASSGPANWRAGAAPPAWTCRPAAGMEYNPFTRRYWLSGDTSVNYLLACRKPAHDGRRALCEPCCSTWTAP